MGSRDCRSVRGFTLIDLIVAIVIVGILAVAFSLYVVEGIDLWRVVNFRNEVVAQCRLALLRMEREIRQNTLTEVADMDNLQFISINGEGNDTRLRYRLLNNELKREVDSNLDGDFLDAGDFSNILARNVTALTFTYYDRDNNELATPVAVLSDVYRIRIEIELESGSETKTLFSQVYPRNF